jgi:uncharacterized protein (DUF488 family)
MEIYTMGFTKKSAEQFFELIIKNQIEILIDVRLNNQSQLAGFTKGRDLKYLLDKICHCNYDHDTDFAPTKGILQKYKKDEMTWIEYEKQYRELILKRDIVKKFDGKYAKYSKVLLLCSEVTEEHCYRRLLAEYLQKELDCNVLHI